MRFLDLLDRSRDLVKNWAWLLEGRSPLLSRQLLQAALTAGSPIGTTVGINLETIDDEQCTLGFNKSWPDLLTQDQVSAAGIVNAVELAAKFFWDRHLLMVEQSMQICDIHVHFLTNPVYPLKVRYELESSARESILAELRSNGEVCLNTECKVIYEERVVATCEIGVKLAQKLRLSAKPLEH